MIDTNVILDDSLNRLPLAADAKIIMNMITDGRLNGYVTANSVADIFYLTDKRLGVVIARKAIRSLLLNLTVISIGGQECIDALELPIDDFEDALVVVCAENAKLDYIISNDKGFLSQDISVPIICPSDFLAKYER